MTQGAIFYEGRSVGQTSNSVAQCRSGTPDQESRRTVNQLLTALEASRDERELLVMAASNEIEHLDPALIGPAASTATPRA